MAAATFGNISPAKLEDGLADCLQLHSYTALRRRTLHNFIAIFAQHAIVCATLPSHPPNHDRLIPTTRMSQTHSASVGFCIQDARL